MNFIEFVPFGVVHEHDRAMLQAELCQRRLEPIYVKLICSDLFGAGLTGRYFGCAVARPIGRIQRDGAQALPSVAPRIVDELVVENAAEPGPERSDAREFVATLVNLDQYLLNEVLGISC
jgi:hypothetical protein